jgi:hypothetical protein
MRFLLGKFDCFWLTQVDTPNQIFLSTREIGDSVGNILAGVLAILAVIAFALAGALAIGFIGLTLALGFAAAGRVIWARWLRR